MMGGRHVEGGSVSAREFDAVVIGSGLGGLTAGALLARAGLRVLVLERNDRFGGAATTYTHGGLTVEASLHEMSGADKEGPVTEVLRALDVLDDVPLVPVGDFYEVRSHLLGEPFVMPHRLDQAAAACVERFPGRAGALREYHRLLVAIYEGVGLTGSEHSVGWWITTLRPCRGACGRCCATCGRFCLRVCTSLRGR